MGLPSILAYFLARLKVSSEDESTQSLDLCVGCGNDVSVQVTP